MREIQSLARGLHILDVIMNSREAQSVTELADLLDIDKSSVSRLLRTLESYGYVQAEKTSRKYTVGKRLYSIGWQLTNRYSLREIARPYLHRLAHQSGECAHIGVYASGKAMVIDDVQSETSLLRVVGNTGRLICLHNTAVGKGLIAFGEFPMPTELPPITPQTITDFPTLEANLDQIRQAGYALDDEENESGVRCLAAPVFDVSGITVGTLGISGPTIRITYENMEQFADMVKQAAYELSCELGHDE